MGAPRGDCGVQRVPKAGHSSGLARPCSTVAAMHSAGSSTHVAWTLNLEAAGTADIAFRRQAPIHVRARRLPDGAERDRVFRTFGQHPFPANIVYRLARGHIRAVGVYFAIEPATA